MTQSKEPAGLVQCNVRMPQRTVDAVDAWVAQMNEKEGWQRWTRSDLIRDIIERAIAQRPAVEEGRALMRQLLGPGFETAQRMPPKPGHMIVVDGDEPRYVPVGEFRTISKEDLAKRVGKRRPSNPAPKAEARRTPRAAAPPAKSSPAPKPLKKPAKRS